MQPIEQGTQPRGDWQVEVFYDGECPLCVREIRMLAWMDRRRRRIRFTDIASPEFQPSQAGVDLPTLMAEIHGRLPDGQGIKGVEVFRRLYAAVGFGPIVALTRWPLIAPALDWAYRVFARNRLRLTGRCGPSSAACAARRA